MSAASSTFAATAAEGSPALPRVGIVMPLAQQRGGAESALMQYLGGLPAAQRGTVHVCFLEDGPLVAGAAALGCPVAVIATGRLRQPLRWAASVARLRRWLAANRIDVVLSWMTKAQLYAGPAALAAGLPAVWWQHGLPARRGLDRLATRVPARRILSCSQAAADAQRALGTPRAAIRTIYPPVDLERLARAPTLPVARAALGLPARGLVVGIVARLQRWKGIHVFLEAARLLLEERRDVFFVVVGGPHALEPEYAAEVERRARELGLADRVRFTGHRTDVADWVAAMDVVVNASFGEPFGMTIVEAMALGKAVVATRLGGPLEIVTDGVDGLLVAPDDAAALAAALRRLEDESLRFELGSAARERAERFSLPRFVAELNLSLREVVER